VVLDDLKIRIQNRKNIVRIHNIIVQTGFKPDNLYFILCKSSILLDWLKKVANSMQGACVRLDTTLVDFSDMRWVRGDITFLYNGDTSPETALAVLDNQVTTFITDILLLSHMTKISNDPLTSPGFGLIYRGNSH
jgi:hypothetical protein